MGMQEWATFLGLIGLVIGGLTKVRVWLFKCLKKIDLGTKEKNSNLRTVVGVFFFSSLGIISLILSMSLMTGVGYSAIQNYLVTEQSLQKIEIKSATNLVKNVPYLGSIRQEPSEGNTDIFLLVNFQNEIVGPLQKAMLLTVSFVGMVTLLLFGILGVIAFILTSTDSEQD